jgi:hypothetical protein
VAMHVTRGANAVQLHKMFVLLYAAVITQLSRFCWVVWFCQFSNTSPVQLAPSLAVAAKLARAVSTQPPSDTTKPSLCRKAFAELYAGQAGELAEKMARLRAKESAARVSFRLAVERYIPNKVLAGLGLTAVPPHCVISVPQPDAGLAAVTPDDLKRAPAPQQARWSHDCTSK